MTSYTSTFLKEISWRGYIADCTDHEGLDSLLYQCEQSGKPLVAYIGFDCTAPSLHVGSLIQIMMLRRLQQAGHKPIVLMGGATTKIGDPSGKDESRKMLSDADIEHNKASIKKVFSHFLHFEQSFSADSSAAFMVDNADWLEGLEYIKFLRDYGSLLSVNKMIKRESVKLRLEREQELSFLEFNYMVMQAFDFVKLAENHGCRLQIGGSDQWGNIVGGIELNRKSPVINSIFKKKIIERINSESKNPYLQIPTSAISHPISGSWEGEEDEEKKARDKYYAEAQLHGLTTPLLTTASGGKMGKTEKGAVWLNADQLSPYDYWQFWRNTEDADVVKFLRLFTDKKEEEIAELATLKDAAINQAKIALANAATAMLHGETAAKEAEATALAVFSQGGIGGELPTIEIPASELSAGIPAYQLFHTAGLEESLSKARKLIEGGGAKVNDAKVDAIDTPITSADLRDGVIKLSKGKKQHLLVKAV